MIDTKELRRLAEAATPGPWRMVPDERTYRDLNGHPTGNEYIAGYDVHSDAREIIGCEGINPAQEADAEFIATINPATVLALLDRVERLDDILSELIEVAVLRGDCNLPHPADDPKLWRARMQSAWDEARATLEGES